MAGMLAAHSIIDDGDDDVFSALPFLPCFRFIGEWYEKEPPHHAPTEEQVEEGSINCFIVGGIYLGWTVFALGEPMAADLASITRLYVIAA
jgi:hypothetical protein